MQLNKCVAHMLSYLKHMSNALVELHTGGVMLLLLILQSKKCGDCLALVHVAGASCVVWACPLIFL